MLNSVPGLYTHPRRELALPQMCCRLQFVCVVLSGQVLEAQFFCSCLNAAYISKQVASNVDIVLVTNCISRFCIVYSEYHFFSYVPYLCSWKHSVWEMLLILKLVSLRVSENRFLMCCFEVLAGFERQVAHGHWKPLRTCSSQTFCRKVNAAEAQLLKWF